MAISFQAGTGSYWATGLLGLAVHPFHFILVLPKVRSTVVVYASFVYFPIPKPGSPPGKGRNGPWLFLENEYKSKPLYNSLLFLFVKFTPSHSHHFYIPALGEGNPILEKYQPLPPHQVPCMINTWLCDSLPQNVDLISVKNPFLFLSFCTLSPFVFSMSYIKNNCMVRPLKINFLLLSVPPQPEQCLLQLHHLHMNDLLTYTGQAQPVIILIKGTVWGMALCWFPW